MVHGIYKGLDGIIFQGIHHSVIQDLPHSDYKQILLQQNK